MTFSVALSGLNNLAKSIDVTGNNVANANTTGFKMAQAHFMDVYASALTNGGAQQAEGLGTAAPLIIQSFTQGQLNDTGNSLDVAISGKGFFRIVDVDAKEVSYTRDGSFDLKPVPPEIAGTDPVTGLERKQSWLVTASGLRVSGYLADFSTDRSGVIPATGDPTDIIFDQTISGGDTSKVTMRVNLDVNAKQKLDATNNPLPFAPNDPNTYNYSYAVPTYDAMGGEHQLKVFFVKQAAPNTWNVFTTRGDINVTAGSLDLTTISYPLVVTAGSNDTFGIQLGSGAALTATLPPNATGYADADALRAAVQTAIDGAVGSGNATVTLNANQLAVTPAGGMANLPLTLSEGNGALAACFGTVRKTASEQTAAQTVTFDTMGKIQPAGQLLTIDYGNGTVPISLDLGGSSQYASDFNVSLVDQDGFAGGEVTTMYVDQEGVIHATYSNGLTRSVAQLVLANFINPNGLVNIGSNRWEATRDSGDEQLGRASRTGFGVMQGGSLENANVDISAALVDLIVQQRNYQANAQAVKAQDQLLQTLAGIR